MKKEPMHGEIQGETREVMNKIAITIDHIFNGDETGNDRKWGFALLMFPFGEAPKGRINYISNSDRQNMIVAMKEFIAKCEGQYHETKAIQ